MNGPPLILPPMLKAADIMKVYGVFARKQLSQNFILHERTLDILASKTNSTDCVVCEVGAGPGNFTAALLRAQTRHVAAVEVDYRFLPCLKLLEDAASGFLSVHHANILMFNYRNALQKAIRVNWEEDPPGIRLVGNLPFNISLGLLFQWLEAISERAGPFQYGRIPMYLVFQKEVADIMVARPHSHERGRLSVMTQNLCEVQQVHFLNRRVFTPVPKVDCCLVELIPRREPLVNFPFDEIEQVVCAVFNTKNKFLSNSLSLLFKEEDLCQAMLEYSEIDPSKKAIDLSVDDVGCLVRAFKHVCNENRLQPTPLNLKKPPKILALDQEQLPSGILNNFSKKT